MSKSKEECSLLFTLDSSANRIYKEDYTRLLGRILTIIDAIGLNDIQSKAIKDMVHGAVFQYREDHQNLMQELFERLYEAEDGVIGEHGNRLPSIVNSLKK